MSLRSLLCLLLAWSSVSLTAQTQLNLELSFQSDPAKKYSIVVPTSYNPANPAKLMLGLHPFNTNRWSGQTWCEYLNEFAETNNLLLLCPDGGDDGRIDDPIDTAFTSHLLDIIGDSYTIDNDKVYAMGFSWGGRTTYSYGLRNTHRLHGFMPIGAATNGLSINSVAMNAEGQPFYLIHGSNDSPNSNFTPFINLLEANEAIVNSKLLSGVGHTIDFADNLAILSEAYRWIDSVNCAKTTTGTTAIASENLQWSVGPNPLALGDNLWLSNGQDTAGPSEMAWYDIQGRLLYKQGIEGGNNPAVIKIPVQAEGVYFLILQNEKGQHEVHRLVVQQ